MNRPFLDSGTRSVCLKARSDFDCDPGSVTVLGLCFWDRIMYQRDPFDALMLSLKRPAPLNRFALPHERNTLRSRGGRSIFKLNGLGFVPGRRCGLG